jgi:WD40 repeat protein
LASGGNDGRVVIWDVDNQNKVKVLNGGAGAITSIITLGDGKNYKKNKILEGERRSFSYYSALIKEL